MIIVIFCEMEINSLTVIENLYSLKQHTIHLIPPIPELNRFMCKFGDLRGRTKDKVGGYVDSGSVDDKGIGGYAGDGGADLVEGSDTESSKTKPLGVELPFDLLFRSITHYITIVEGRSFVAKRIKEIY